MTHPPATTLARPHRASAVVVLVRGRGEGLQVFWARRSDAVSFMPGFRAFIGGTVDPDDAALPVEGANGDRALELACAFRETFEEAGVVVGHPHPGDPAVLEAERTALLAGTVRFSDLAARHGWRFRAGMLRFAGRWITPPFAPVRFDTPYFVAQVPEGQEPTVHVGELAQGEWVRPVAALEQWQQGYEAFAAPILYTLIGLAHGEEGITRLHEAPAASATPVQRIEVMWGFVLHPMATRPLPPATHTNAYLVGEPEMALVDPGSGDPAELERLFAVIDALERDRRRLKLVLITHDHPDHVGGVEAVRERYGVPVAAHAETAKRVRCDFTLADDDWVPLVPGVGDWGLRVLHTPGHHPGHLCFFHPRTGALLTGDHIPGGRGTVIIDPPEGDMTAYLDSLRRLETLPITRLFPGHGGPQGAALARVRQLIAHRLEREGKVLAALEREPLPIEALVERAYDDTPRDLWRYAERSLLAHLLKLEHEGRAVRDGERWRLG
jgi:endoribonuclease LACTB2